MSDKKTFLLMNKNVVVLSFCIIQDIFSENYIVESIENKFLIPRNLRDLQFWISKDTFLTHVIPWEDCWNYPVYPILILGIL